MVKVQFINKCKCKKVNKVNITIAIQKVKTRSAIHDNFQVL